uniref:SGNH hydrolase-type esterase domain-containing protein n=1 Tax=Salarias fasciatus TaxID=181472 RepID=A0A672HVB6_SALFA
MASSPLSSFLSCSVCRMLSQNPASLDDRGICVKCSVLTALEARVTELEERLRRCEGQGSASYSEVAAGLAACSRSERSVSKPSPAACPEQPGQDQDRFVTVRRKASAKHRHVALQEPLHVCNRFSPLSDDTPAELDTLVIGSSIVRDVKLPAVKVRCYPGARVGDIEGNLRLLKQEGRRFRRVVIHAGGNDARRRQSEVLKLQVASLCELAKSMSDAVIFSGPLPNLVNDEMYSRLSSFNRWLSRWSEENGVIFLNNWCTFWGKPGLIRRDGIHPTLDGAALLAHNMADRLRTLN